MMMMSRTSRPSTALIAAAALLVPAGTALAESQYGYDSTGTGTVTAQARVNLSISVPKMILLRVGSAATTDTLSWNTSFSVATAPTAPVNGNNQAGNWGGTAPTATTSANPAALAVYAWTNNANGGRLSYTATAFAANGPTLGNVSVTSGAGLAHPTPSTLAAASTAGTDFAAGTVATGSWTYALDGTGSAAWRAGVYTATVTYTATSL